MSPAPRTPATTPVGTPTPGTVAPSVPEPATDVDAEVAARLRLAITRLARQLRQQTVGGLTASQAAALAMVERLGEPSLGELASAEGVRPPSMTRIVDGLTGAGLVERVVDVEDRRFARVRITAEGRRTLQRSRSAKTAFLARRLRRLSEPERAAMADLVALLEHLVGGR